MREQQKKEIGLETFGQSTIELCCMCSRKSKAEVKKVSVLDPEDEKSRYRAYLNISTIKKNKKYTVPTNPNWRLIVVGTKLQLKVLHFYKMKDAVVEPTCEFVALVDSKWKEDSQAVHGQCWRK